MRMMLKVSIGTEAGNRAVKDGRIDKVMTRVLDQVHPEQSYFMIDHGHRSALLFFDLKEPNQMVSHLEPLFSELDATLELTPVMTAEELKKGLEGLGRATGGR